VIISGFATNWCCNLTAYEAVCRDFRVILLSDGTAAMDLPDMGWGPVAHEKLHEVFLTNFAVGGGQVSTIDEILSELKSK
jgi:ureidoacrylate peracid hydrolase